MGAANIVKKLLIANSDIFSLTDTMKASALIYAAAEGHANCIQAILGHTMLLETSKPIFDLPDMGGRTALISAVSESHIPALAMLLRFTASKQV